MAIKFIIGKNTGNLYKSTDERVKEFEDIFQRNPQYYSEWFVTCIQDAYQDNRLVFKSGVTYRVHDKAPGAYEIATGRSLMWLEEPWLSQYFKPAVKSC